MRKLLLTSVAVALTGWIGIADAQNAPSTSGQTSSQTDQPPMRGPMMGGEMPRREREEEHWHGRFGEGGMMLRTNAAIFRIRRGDTSVFIKCADNESTQACIAAAGTLLDKLNSQTPRP